MRPTNLLLVKLSSLGDVVHTLAAVSDIKRRFPDMTLTWAVEEAFAPLIAGHVCVDRVITVPFRRLKEHRRLWCVNGEVKTLLAALRKAAFSHALDAQGLIKSALLTRLAGNGKRIGYDSKSAREAPAACLYQQRIAVAPALHAITRTRRLFARAFDYSIDETILDFALPAWSAEENTKQLFFFHGTTWPSKLLPESTWRELIRLAAGEGYRVFMLWGDTTEQRRAIRICEGSSSAKVLPATALPALQELLRKCAGVITVDTGLGHLSAALGVPTLGIFGPTDAKLAGMRGAHAHNLASPRPCMRRNCRHDEPDDPGQAQCCMAHWKSTAIWSAFRGLREKIDG